TPRPASHCRHRHGQRGFVLVTMAMTTVGIFAVAGLAVDVGHIFIAKNELQAYCDSAALSAAGFLDGTTAGITHAGNAVAASGNKWNFDTASISAPTVTYATSAAGPWVSSPNPATGYSYVRVSATAPYRYTFSS